MSQPSFLFSSSPHVHGGDSVPKVMRTVIWALMPATAFSVFTFGWPALLVILITILSCVVAEHVVQKMRQRASTLDDQSAALTGLLLALTLPPYSPWWVCVVGGVFAIVVAKQLYGGLGYNMFNPALIARVFLLISFPVELTSWPAVNPLLGEHSYTLSQAIIIIFGGGPAALGMNLDALTAATPLGQYRMQVGLGKSVEEALGGAYAFNYQDAATGLIGGSLGETSALLLALGGGYLLYRRLITWHIPVSMILGCVVPAAIMQIIDSGHYPGPIFHLLTGGLLIGAFFMATDMVTSPVTKNGQLIFGAGCGLLTYIIRTWGGYPEGVSFAVVLMNCTVPLIDEYTRPAVYGKPKDKKAKA
ncbi:MAG: RnfABCDGE type electron transport complex subunit D [Magnetococcales bacterium]|nr:RnfABCDGE type electron transport complex subunit D [Magnetococcales bacterium]